jgi:hypothetical protein
MRLEPSNTWQTIKSVVSGGFFGLFILGLLSCGWWLPYQTHYRLRWHVVANTPIRKGQPLTANRVRGAFNRLPEDASFVSDPALLIGRYPRQDFKKDERLEANLFSINPPNQAPKGGLTVLVEVSAADAAILAPGMRLAFVQTRILLPEKLDTLAGLGFLVTAITPTADKKALLTTVVPSRWRCLAKQLTEGQWRPIVISQEDTDKSVVSYSCPVVQKKSVSKQQIPIKPPNP